MSAKILRFPDGKDLTAEKVATPQEVIEIRKRALAESLGALQGAFNELIQYDHKVDYNFEGMVLAVPNSTSTSILYACNIEDAIDILDSAYTKLENIVAEGLLGE